MNKEIENAMKELSNWLSNPHELGKIPSKIEYVKTIEDKDGIKCHIFKYKKSILSKWFLGISSESGSFSEMKEYDEKSDEEDALRILNMLKEYWKNLAKQYQNK